MKLVTGSSPLTPLLLLQIALTIACLAIAVFRPGIGDRFFSSIEDVLRRIAHRRLAPVLVVGILPLALRALLLPVYAVPTPSVHDEYGYLLQADTFASGRLTNPTPPSPRHFESIYILTKPTYNSQYQPAQGMLLAFGTWPCELALAWSVSQHGAALGAVLLDALRMDVSCVGTRGHFIGHLSIRRPFLLDE